jgi:hypothetical protein
MDDGTPVRAVMHTRALSGGSGIVVDPTFGLAPVLHLGVLQPSSNPDAAAEYEAPNPPPPGVVQPFSRGMAMFQMTIVSMDAVGSGRTITVDQGPGPALDVVSTPFDVLPPSLLVTGATALGDGQGRINRVRLALNEPIHPSSLPLDPAHFSLASLVPPGTPPMPGTGVAVIQEQEEGFGRDVLEITFGSGLGKTDVSDVQVRYTPPSSGFLGSDSGTRASDQTIGTNGTVELTDGAPPVLVNAVSQDTDGNGGLDRVIFEFSEPIQFAGGRGTSISGFEPVTNTVAVPAHLRLRTTTGTTALEHLIVIRDPVNPAATSLVGAEAIAQAITDVVRGVNRPAYTNFTCEFVNGRYVLRAGVPIRPDVTLEVLPTGTPQDLAPLLRLGPANGGVERAGSGNAWVGLPDDLVVVSERGAGGANLLLGKTEADLGIAGSTLTLQLTNAPGSGTATPTYLWKDQGDLAFLADRAPVPNRALPFDNAGLGPDFHPVQLLTEASSEQGAGLAMTRTVPAGPVVLDASPSVMPLAAPGPGTVTSLQWSQTGGAPLDVPPHGNGLVTVVPMAAGTYTFELQVQTGSPVVTPYTDSLGRLARTLELTVVPGVQDHTIVLLPGTRLMPGTSSTLEAVAGTPKVATEGVPYPVQVVTTDAYFNEVAAPQGAMVRLLTTDPGDVEPPFRPFLGSTAECVLTPSHAATSFIPEVDDEVLVAFEHGDISHPYVVGSLWNGVRALPRDPLNPTLARFSWAGDARAVRWNIYRTSLDALADLDRDGLPDLGYGTCQADPDQTDTLFVDPEVPPVGGGFLYGGTMTLDVFGTLQEASLGVRKSGLERPNLSPCP